MSRVFVEIQAQEETEETSDFIYELARMYLRWAERHHYHAEALEVIQGREGTGYTRFTFCVEDPEAKLANEQGIHTHVGLSDYRQYRPMVTSTAAVFVYPAPDEQEQPLAAEDLKVTFVEPGFTGWPTSGVRVLHLPTGAEAYVDSEKSRLGNKARAIPLLHARVASIAKTVSRVDGSKSSRARSYLRYPGRPMVINYRPLMFLSDLGVFDGDIDVFHDGHAQ